MGICGVCGGLWVLVTPPPILNIFAKISGISPWVSRINLCKGQQCGLTYMVVRLSDVRSKTGKKYILHVFCTMDGLFRILEKTSFQLICTRLYLPFKRVGHPIEWQQNNWFHTDLTIFLVIFWIDNGSKLARFHSFT